MSIQSQVASTAANYGRRVVTVTQTLPDWRRQEAYRRKTAAFEEWRQKLNHGDRLPRGRFFKGKKPGRKFVVMDEFWQAVSNRAQQKYVVPIDTHKVDTARAVVQQSSPDTRFLLAEDVSFLDLKLPGQDK